MQRRPPRSTLFPYPTLFRSAGDLPLVTSTAGSQLAGARSNSPLTVQSVTGARWGPSEAQRPARTVGQPPIQSRRDRKSTRLNSSHANISYAVFCLKKKINHPIDLPHLAAQGRLWEFMLQTTSYVQLSLAHPLAARLEVP